MVISCNLCKRYSIACTKLSEIRDVSGSTADTPVFRYHWVAVGSEPSTWRTDVAVGSVAEVVSNSCQQANTPTHPPPLLPRYHVYPVQAYTMCCLNKSSQEGFAAMRGDISTLLDTHHMLLPMKTSGRREEQKQNYKWSEIDRRWIVIPKRYGSNANKELSKTEDGEIKRRDFFHQGSGIAEKPWRHLNAAGCWLMEDPNNSLHETRGRWTQKKNLCTRQLSVEKHLVAINHCILPFFSCLNGFAPRSISFVRCWLSATVYLACEEPECRGTVTGALLKRVVQPKRDIHRFCSSRHWDSGYIFLMWSEVLQQEILQCGNVLLCACLSVCWKRTSGVSGAARIAYIERIHVGRRPKATLWVLIKCRFTVSMFYDQLNCSNNAGTNRASIQIVPLCGEWVVQTQISSALYLKMYQLLGASDTLV